MMTPAAMAKKRASSILRNSFRPSTVAVQGQRRCDLYCTDSRSFMFYSGAVNVGAKLNQQRVQRGAVLV